MCHVLKAHFQSIYPFHVSEPLGVFWNGLTVIFNYSEYMTLSLCEKL